MRPTRSHLSEKSVAGRVEGLCNQIGPSSQTVNPESQSLWGLESGSPNQPALGPKVGITHVLGAQGLIYGPPGPALQGAFGKKQLEPDIGNSWAHELVLTSISPMADMS